MRAKTAVIIRAASTEELGLVQAFYHANGYQPSLGPSDRILVALDCGELCGALRLCEEGGVLLLRGMRVSQPFQRQGIGSRLLRAAEELIGDRACFCIAHRHLESFYSRAGFHRAGGQQAPPFLRERCAGYMREHPVDVLILHRPGAGPPRTRRGHDAQGAAS